MDIFQSNAERHVILGVNRNEQRNDRRHCSTAGTTGLLFNYLHRVEELDGMCACIPWNWQFIYVFLLFATNRDTDRIDTLKSTCVCTSMSPIFLQCPQCLAWTPAREIL